MKKLTLLIIFLTIFFANIKYSNASSYWYIGELLDLKVWIEEYDLTLGWIENMYFSNYNTQLLFNEYQDKVLLLNQVIIEKYRNEEFSYYQVNWIITTQKNFVYHINKLFYNIQLKDYYPNERNLDDVILNHYSLAKTYYERLQYLVYR